MDLNTLKATDENEMQTIVKKKSRIIITSKMMSSRQESTSGKTLSRKNSENENNFKQITQKDSQNNYKDRLLIFIENMKESKNPQSMKDQNQQTKKQLNKSQLKQTIGVNKITSQRFQKSPPECSSSPKSSLNSRQTSWKRSELMRKSLPLRQSLQKFDQIKEKEGQEEESIEEIKENLNSPVYEKLFHLSKRQPNLKVENMSTWKEKRGIPQKAKVFMIVGSYDDIKQALLDRD